ERARAAPHGGATEQIRRTEETETGRAEGRSAARTAAPGEDSPAGERRAATERDEHARAIARESRARQGTASSARSGERQRGREVKRKNKTERFSKEGERGGYVFSTQRSRPLPPWMNDPGLLPKAPPKKATDTDRRR